MKILFLLIGIFAYSFLQAQPGVDSLKLVVSELNGDAKAEALNQLSALYSESDSTQAIACAQEAISIATVSENKRIIADGYFNIGECYYNSEQFNQALPNYQLALNLFKEIGDLDRTGETLNSLGLVYYFNGEYNLSIEKQIEAIKCLEKSIDKHELAHVYSNMGMVYSRTKDYNMAISSYKKAAKINQGMNDVYSVAVNMNGIGVGYYNLGQIDSAKVYYQNSLQIFRQLEDRRRVAIALNNIANIYVDEGDSLSVALKYYQEAITVFEELNDIRNKTFVMEGLGCVYRQMGDYQQALTVFYDGMAMARKHNIGYYIIQLYYRDISATYELLGNTGKALSAYKSYKLYGDSLLREEKIKQITELEKRFESEKKEAEIVRLNAEKEVAELQIQKNIVVRRFGLVAIFFLMVIVVSISLGYYNKRKTNVILSQKNLQIKLQRDELEKLNASKNKFFSIIAHDLKNPFHTVMGYSYLLSKEYDRFKDGARRKYAGDIYKSTNIIFRLLQNLLDWSRSQTGSLKYEPVDFQFLGLYENIYGLLKPVADQKNIELVGKMSDNVLVFADPMMIETILRNLVNNAIKFSKQGSKVETEVRVDDRDVIVSVMDYGVGMSEEDLHNLFRIDSKVKRKGTMNEDGSGLGLILCKEFVTTNKGTIWAQSSPGKGSTFCFTIPLSRFSKGQQSSLN